MEKIRYVFGILFVGLFLYLSMGEEKTLNKKDIQDRMDSVIPFSFEYDNGEIIVNNANIITIENKVGLETEIIYDTSSKIVKNIKGYFNMEDNLSNDAMIFKFSFDIVKDSGIIYFDNIDNVYTTWKKTGDKVKIFENRRFVRTFTNTMESEDVKLYRIGNNNPFSKEAIIVSMLEFDGIYSGENDTVIVKYKIKDRYVLLVFLIVVLLFGRELFILFIHIYQRFLSKRKKYICARGVKEGVTCSSSVLNVLQKEGLMKGVVEYYNTLKICEQSFVELKKIKKGKKMKNEIRATKISDCVFFFKK